MKRIYQLIKESQLTNYLTNNGYSSSFVNYVNTLPKLIQKNLGNILNTRGVLQENELRNIIQEMLSNQNQVAQVPKVNPNKVLDSRFSSVKEKEQFFTKIPKDYINFVKKILNDSNFSFIVSEDTSRLLSALNKFTTLRNKENINIEKDINKYNGLLQLEDVVSKFENFGSNRQGYLQYNPLSLKGVEAIKTLKDGSITYRVTDAESLKKLGVGTKWCTREDYNPCQAERYLKQYEQIYVIIKEGKPVIQFTPDLDQVMDVRDEQVSLPRDLYSLFAVPLSRKTGLPANTIKQFESEKASGDRNKILKLVKNNGLGLMLASDEIRNDPKIVVEALKNNQDAIEYVSKNLSENENFQLEVDRISGNLGYPNYESDYESYYNVIYGGTEEFGIEATLTNWDFEDAYGSFEKNMDRDRGGRRLSSDMYQIAGLFASAAVDSDSQNIKNGTFDYYNVKKEAFELAKRSKKNPKYNYQKIQPGYLQQIIAPYLAQAERHVIEELKLYGNEYLANTKDMKERIQRKAIEMHSDEREFDTRNMNGIEDFDPENQRRFLSAAINKRSAISAAYAKSQENNDSFYDNYNDSYYDEGDRPDENDFDSVEEWEKANSEWEEDTQKRRDEDMDQYRKDNFPWSFDDEIIESIGKDLASKPFKLPDWITNTFANSQSYKPNMLHALERAMSSKKANGWYGIVKKSSYFTLDQVENKDEIYDKFKETYDKATGSSWSKDKFFSRASGYRFYGNKDGYITVREQNSGMLKMTGMAGNKIGIYKGMKELLSETSPVWGMVTKDISDMAEKAGFKKADPQLVRNNIQKIPSYVFGGAQIKNIQEDGGVEFLYSDTGSSVKYLIGNVSYFANLM